MKAYVQGTLGSDYNVDRNFILYYMSGTIPTTPAELKALVDMSDMSDIHAKCVGSTLTTGVYSQDTTGIGTYAMTCTLVDARYSWLKGGAYPSASAGWYILPPSKAYYANGRKSTLYSMPPSLFAMPRAAIDNTHNNITSIIAVQYRDTATSTYGLKAAGSEIQYILEYDQPTTVSAYRFGNGPSLVGNDYVYYIGVEYWDGSAWVVAATATSVTGPNAITTTSFTAVTASKFRISLYPYSETAGEYAMLFGSGFALMHTAVPASMSVADITWGILMPFPESSNTNPYTVYTASGTSAYSIITSKDYKTIDYMGNPSGVSHQSPYYGVITYNVPAIIDTCSQDSLVSKMAISKSTGLTSLDHPTLASYKYYAGDLL